MPKPAEELLARAYALSSDEDSKALYRDWAETYDRTMINDLGYLTPAKTAELLAEHLHSRTSRILDIGAGTGLAGAELLKRGFDQIDALDYSAEMLSVAKKTGAYTSLIQADLNQPINIADQTYSAMICTGTFTHAHVGANCLEELFRILKPGGFFACTVHKDVWKPQGFEDQVRRMKSENRLHVRVAQPGPYFISSEGDDGCYYLWQKSTTPGKNTP